MVKILIANGANVNKKYNGQTPLHWAAEEGKNFKLLRLDRKGYNFEFDYKQGTKM